MTLESRHRYLSLAIVAILSLELVFIGQHMMPVQGLNKPLAFKSILSFLYLLKKKKPEIGFIAFPLPLPIPFKVNKHEELVVNNESKETKEDTVENANQDVPHTTYIDHDMDEYSGEAAYGGHY
ncbi:unnamed protein product [Medioppia subpectinata]|uniref:Uncharacterized protein n=1 Tax=Medioppia subpectinata TaxID=1979941 RepID=A0A7R9KLA6_9ACAR|nr:unnamed protein product [Medioppia subpectinata]CAG2105690.1 unnamed protein product [Medioppia subpectinata]